MDEKIGKMQILYSIDGELRSYMTGVLDIGKHKKCLLHDKCGCLVSDKVDRPFTDIFNIDETTYVRSLKHLYKFVDDNRLGFWKSYEHITDLNRTIYRVLNTDTHVVICSPYNGKMYYMPAGDFENALDPVFSIVTNQDRFCEHIVYVNGKWYVLTIDPRGVYLYEIMYELDC
jgi:hypothetical protein